MLDKETPAGPATLVDGLNSTTPGVADLHAFVRRKDGLEVIFASDRGGTPGLYDLYVSTRPTTVDLWSPPVKLGPEINSARSEARPRFPGTGPRCTSGLIGNGTMVDGGIQRFTRPPEQSSQENPIRILQ